MTLDELRADIERRVPVHPECGDYAQAATGEPYVEVVIGGERKDGGGMPAYATSEQHAIRLLHEALLNYIGAHSGTLYWRIFPEVASYEWRRFDDWAFDLMGSRTFWAGYARLLVSDKPQIQPQTLSARAA